MVKKFRISLCLAIPAFVGLTLLMPSEGVAQGKKGKVVTVSDQQLIDAVHVLRNARHTLQMADHDYGGHRATAVRDITAAVHQLRQALDGAGKAKLKDTGKKDKKGPFVKEPQVVSDAQLTSAIPVLRQVQTALQQTTQDFGGHRAQAAIDLDAAIRELNIALQYSKQKNQNK